MGGGHEVPAETVSIPATGHSWGAAAYVWADDNSSVTATRTCTTNPSHTAIETAQTTSSVTKQATCEQAGETTYTAEFTDEAFETQTKTIANIPATGHSWMADWLWRSNNSVRVHFHCTNDPGHFQIIDNARITSVTTPATCEEPGQTVYTATITFDGTVYTDTRTVIIPKTGHYYDNPVWTWADDYTSATVTFTCTHDNSHTVTVPGTVTSEITQEPSYVTPGERTYTAVFQYNGNTFQDQKTEEIPVLSPNGVTDEGLSWAVADGVLTVSLTDDAQSTEIPDYASAGDAPWAEATAELNVSKIVVEEDITKVGSNSFAGLENLEVMNLPRSLEQLADDSVDVAVLSTVRVVYAGTESEWEALTQGTAFQDVNVISSHIHSWGEWYQKTPATCTADAILECECEICHTTETMTDENTATGHAWGSPDWQWTEDHTGATAIFTCDNDSSHIESIPAEISYTGTVPTCIAGGEAVYTAEVSFEGTTYTDEKTVQGSALGHDWGDATYTWTNDYSSVTAECACTRNESHIESETVQTTSEITKQPGCESKGETTYTAVFSKDAFETQTKTVANIAAAGHDWRGPNWQWPTNTQARALFICRNNSTHTQSVFATATPEVIKEETCETDGQVVYTAVVEFEGNTYTGQKPVTIPRKGHRWNNAEYTWADDYSSAAVTLTCDNDNTHTKTLSCTVTSEITQEPSYTTPGVKTYTAYVEYERRVYQDQKTEVIPVLTPSGVTDDGLSWEIAEGVLTVSLTDGAQSTEIPDYTSADDAPWAEAAAELNVSKIVVEEGITKVGANSFAGMESLDEISLPQSLEELAEDSVDAAVLSTVNVNYAGSESEWEALTQGTAFQDVNMTSTHTHVWGEWYQKTPATCTADAILERECEICHTTETMTDENTATGHAWGSPDWQWTEDHTGATAIFTCDNDSSHIESIPAEISYTGTVPTCIAGGEAVYTAEVSFEGTTYTDEKTVQGSALGHDWGDATYTWTNDYSSVTAECACTRNESHIESETVQTTSEITKQPGCESKGETTYTAVFSKDAFETQTKTVANIAAAGHDWRGPNWQWPTNTQARALFICRNNSTHTQSVFATATPEVIKEETCETDGQVVYTAVVEFEGNTYTGQKPVTIPRKGHRWNNAEYTWADDYSSAAVTLTCDNDNTHTKTLSCTVTSEITQEPSYTTPGVKTYTAYVEYERRVYQDQKTEVIPVLTPSGVTDDGLSWEIAEGVLTVSLTDGAQSTEIPDYTSADDAPWAEAAAELNVSKIVVEEGITKVGANSFAGMESLDEISLPQSLEELAEDSVDAAVLSTVNVNYAGSESEWEALTQGTAFQDVNMTSTHTHVWGEWYQKTPATCTADAILERECEICHMTETMTDENTATGHSWDSGKVTKPATTAAAGVKTYKCSCGETKTESIPRLKIIEKITISKKPTIQKPAPAKGKITVKWKHFKHTSKKTKPIWKKIKKVQVQCATDSAFRSIVKTAIVGRGKTKATIKGLKKKTTYYVRVRYFDGKGYSAWSKVKKVKTK